MVRLSRDASKQERLASFSLRSTAQSNRGRVLPSFIDNAWTGASYAYSFARSTDGDRLLTAIIDRQICLMLHDGEKGKLDLAVGLSQSGGSDMRDYSLHNVRSRPAGEGRRELTTRDLGTGTRGVAASEHANLAVCVLPGTELSLHSFAQ